MSRAQFTLGLVLLLASACGPETPPTANPADVAGESAEGPDHRLYDAQGADASFEAYVATLADVDLIAFGEHHYDAIGSRYELELLEALAEQERPVALAMEFFEANTQADLDAYLAGEIDEPTFRERTKRDEKYDDSHRPLIEACKARGIPVIAANAPRELVTTFRKQELSYEEWRATRSAQERALLPEWSKGPDDEHKARFVKTMGADRGERFWPSMALWNDAMAESMAKFKDAHPEHRIMFVVGGFHVAAGLGTITQYRARRGDDRTAVISMLKASEDGDLALADDERGEGDLLLKVR